MEEDSLVVFCESVKEPTEEQVVVSEDTGIPTHDDIRDCSASSTVSNDELVHNEISAESDDLVNNPAEIAGYKIYENTDQVEMETDPTETLQNILKDSQSSNMSTRPVKQEPGEEESEVEEENPRHSKAKGIQVKNRRRERPPVSSKSVKTPGTSGPTSREQSRRSSSKLLNTTRSGRKSTFLSNRSQQSNPVPQKETKKSKKVEVTKKVVQHKKGSHPRQRKSNQDSGPENTLEGSSSVLLQRMSASELANYGIEMDRSVKDEPMDFDGLLGQSHRKSPSKRPEKEDNLRAKKRVIDTQSLLGMDKSETKKIPMSSFDSNSSEKGAQKSSSKVTKTNSPSEANGLPAKKTRRSRGRKVLMEFPPSSSDEDDIYLLPEVTIGQDTVSHQTHDQATSYARTQFQSAGTENKQTNNYTEVSESIKVYVFTCGHACGVCNTQTAKEWLNESGFRPANPLVSATKSRKYDSTASSTAAKNLKPTSTITMNIPVQRAIAPSTSSATKTRQQTFALPQTVLQNILKSAKSLGSEVQIQVAAKPKQSDVTYILGKSQPMGAVESSTNKTLSSTTTSTMIFNSSNNHNSQKVQSAKIIAQPISQTLQSPVTSISSKNLSQNTGTIVSSEKNPTEFQVLQNITSTSAVQEMPIVDQNRAKTASVLAQSANTGKPTTQVVRNLTKTDLTQAMMLGNTMSPLCWTTIPETVPSTNPAVPVIQTVLSQAVKSAPVQIHIPQTGISTNQTSRLVQIHTPQTGISTNQTSPVVQIHTPQTGIPTNQTPGLVQIHTPQTGISTNQTTTVVQMVEPQNGNVAVDFKQVQCSGTTIERLRELQKQ